MSWILAQFDRIVATLALYLYRSLSSTLLLHQQSRPFSDTTFLLSACNTVSISTNYITPNLLCLVLHSLSTFPSYLSFDPFSALLENPSNFSLALNTSLWPYVDYSANRVDVRHLPSWNTKSLPMALSPVQMVLGQSWLLPSAVSGSLKVSTPLSSPNHLLRYQRISHSRTVGDRCQGLDILPCLSLLLEFS